MNKKVKYGIAKSMLIQFFKHIVIYTAFVLIVSAFGYLVGKSRIWYEFTPGYPLLRFAHDNWAMLFLFSLFVGCMLIASVHIIRFAKVLGKITGAVSDLSSQRVTYIKLPRQLDEVEWELNQILSQMQQDRQLAKEAEQRKNDMIVYMAHDLKTPLTSVIGYLTLLHDEKEISKETQDKYMEIALRKSERLEELINEFFEVTKYNFSNTVLSMTSINLSVMVEQLIYEFHPLFREKGVTFQTKIEKGIILQCDVDKIERVLDNLLKNAFYYCYENSEILVQLQKCEKENGVVLKIQNAGKTIPQEKLEHLFEQFFRLDSSRSSKTGGSGLGLAIAKEIITLHQGTISCESKNETITFTVFLPCLVV